MLKNSLRFYDGKLMADLTTTIIDESFIILSCLCKESEEFYDRNGQRLKRGSIIYSNSKYEVKIVEAATYDTEPMYNIFAFEKVNIKADSTFNLYDKTKDNLYDFPYEIAIGEAELNQKLNKLVNLLNKNDK